MRPDIPPRARSAFTDAARLTRINTRKETLDNNTTQARVATATALDPCILKRDVHHRVTGPQESSDEPADAVGRIGRSATRLPQTQRYFRDMHLSDVPQVLAIERRAYAFPWPRRYFETCLAKHFTCRLLMSDHTIDGYGIMAQSDASVHILNVCVRPERQGRGLGTRIVAHLLQRAKAAGARVAVLEVRVSNTVARRLYRRMDFTLVGRMRGYYPSERGREDALVLARLL